MLPRAPGNRRDRYLNLRDGAGVTPSVKARRRAYLKKPVRAVDVTNGKGIGDLLDQFRSSSIQARNLGRCLEVFRGLFVIRDVTLCACFDDPIVIVPHT